MIWDDINTKLTELKDEVEELQRTGIDMAKADVEYRRMKALAILAERHNGVPATLAKDAIYNRSDVCEALEQRNCTEVLYEACKERINAYKRELNFLEEQHKHEWSKYAD